MLDIPCSRVAHVYRGGMPFPNDRKGIDFITINYKRVAEGIFNIKHTSQTPNTFNPTFSLDGRIQTHYLWQRSRSLQQSQRRRPLLPILYKEKAAMQTI
jgi:hypothetical protein